MSIGAPPNPFAQASLFDRAPAFDSMIGRLDRLLSEFLIAAKRTDLDEADRQTLKHHADDLIGAGQAALKKLGFDAPTP